MTTIRRIDINPNTLTLIKLKKLCTIFLQQRVKQIILVILIPKAKRLKSHRKKS